MEELGKSDNTQYLELTTLKQINKRLIAEGHLPDACRLQLRLQRDKESTTYCWTVAEFQVIVQHCQQTPRLQWLGDVSHLLGLTGLRISELAQLRWSDLDFDKQLLMLADESRQGSRSVDTPARTLKSKRSRTLPLHVAKE
ncbi:tyrosine-type recombinase/integrase [bacterium]|nr:tyrosine-type recombinase/integrase [bacterium]